MIDPLKKASVNPVTDFTANKLNKAALNPQPLPPKAAQTYTDGAVVAASHANAVSLNPQPLPPREAGTPALTALNPATSATGISTESFGKQIGNMVSSILDKVALNPQPLPPKAIGNVISDLISRIGIIIVSGRTPGTGVMSGDEEEIMPKGPKGEKAADKRLNQAGIIVVGGNVAMPEEEEMPPAPKGDKLSLSFNTLSSKAMSELINQAIQRAIPQGR